MSLRRLPLALLLAGTAAASSPPSPGNPPPPPRALDCKAAFAQPLVLWPADRQMVPVAIQNVKGRPPAGLRIEVTAVRQNELPQASGDDGGKSPRSAHCPDADARGHKLELRAERLGNGTGRLYVIEFRATATDGAVCTGEVVVRVPLEKGKTQDDGPTRRDCTYDATRCD